MSLNSKRDRGRAIVLGALSVLVGVTLALVTAELALRFVSPTSSVYRALPPNLVATFDAGRYAKGVQSPALFKVNSMGFRGREWSTDRASEFRIICIGGSTTESLLNDQNRTWTMLLEQDLDPLPDGRRVWVGNIGKAGLASKHHVVQIKHLGGFDPDLIVVLVGSSDLMSRLKQNPSSDPNLAYSPEEERALEEQSFAVVPSESLFSQRGHWYQSMQLWHFGSVLRSILFDRSERQDPDGLFLERWRTLRAQGARSSVLPPLEAALDAYESNLQEMVRLARDLDAPLLLMTQPSIWRDDLSEVEEQQLWMGGMGEFREVPGSLYYEAAALERGIEAFNQRLLEVCHETGVPCADLAQAIPKSSEYFYDDEHFTDLGEEAVADRVAEAILPLLRQDYSRTEGLGTRWRNGHAPSLKR